MADLGSSNIHGSLSVLGRLNANGDLVVNGIIQNYGDSDTYMQFHDADEWRVVAGGTERLAVNASYTIIDNDLLFRNSTDQPGLLEHVENGTTGYTGYQITRGNGQHWSWMGDDSSVGWYDYTAGEWTCRYYTNNYWSFYANGAKKLQLNKANVTVYDDLLPNNHRIHDLGSSTFGWAEGWFNSIGVNGVGTSYVGTSTGISIRSGQNHRALFIGNASDEANTWLNYSDGMNYLTSDETQGNSSAGTILRTWDGSTYEEILRVDKFGLRIDNGVSTAAYGFFASVDNIHISQNAYYDGSDWRALSTGRNATIQTNVNAGVTLQVRGSCSSYSAGSIINQLVFFQVNCDGAVLMPYVYGDTTTGGAYMRIGSDGRLWRYTSSAKYKTQIEDANDSWTERIYDLRPRWFRSTAGDDRRDWSHWGFIAEEVHEIDPRFVQYTEHDDGTLEPEGVEYMTLTVPIIAEMKKLRARIEELETEVETLRSA